MFICMVYQILVIGVQDLILVSGNTLHNYGKPSLLFSTAFHLQTDGQAEKANSIVKRFPRPFSANKPRSWDTLLAIAEFAYSSHHHQSTGISPFEADLGYIPRMPLDTMATTRRR
jgi:hypothetical protein